MMRLSNFLKGENRARLLAVLLALALPLAGFAQKKSTGYEPGFIITNFDKKVDCEIKNASAVQSCSSIKVRILASGQKLTYEAGDIKYYKRGKEQYETIKRKGPYGKTITSLARIEQKGELTLYSYHLYKSTGQFSSTEVKYYVRRTGGEVEEIKESDFVKGISEFISPNASLTQTVESGVLSYTDIKDVVTFYNDWYETADRKQIPPPAAELVAEPDPVVAEESNTKPDSTKSGGWLDDPFGADTPGQETADPAGTKAAEPTYEKVDVSPTYSPNQYQPAPREYLPVENSFGFYSHIFLTSSAINVPAYIRSAFSNTSGGLSHNFGFGFNFNITDRFSLKLGYHWWQKQFSTEYVAIAQDQNFNNFLVYINEVGKFSYSGINTQFHFNNDIVFFGGGLDFSLTKKYLADLTIYDELGPLLFENKDLAETPLVTATEYQLDATLLAGFSIKAAPSFRVKPCFGVSVPLLPIFHTGIYAQSMTDGQTYEVNISIFLLRAGLILEFNL